MLTIENGVEVFPVDGEHRQPTPVDCHDNWVIDRRWIRDGQSQKSDVSIRKFDLDSEVRNGDYVIGGTYLRLSRRKKANRHIRDGIDRIRWADK